MITITLNKIKAHDPCADGWEKLLAHLGKTEADDDEFPLAEVLKSNGLDDALWCLKCLPEYKNKWRLLAVKFARQVQPLMQDERSIKALDVAERYAKGKATESELSDAWYAAWDATWSAWAARSAAWDAARSDADFDAAIDAARSAESAAKDAARSAARGARAAARSAAAAESAESAAKDAARSAGDAAGSIARSAARGARAAAFGGDALDAAREKQEQLFLEAIE